VRPLRSVDAGSKNPRSRWAAIAGIGALSIVGAVVWVVRDSDTDTRDPDADTMSVGGVSMASLPTPVRLVDSAPGLNTVDGELSGVGAIAAGSTLEVPVRGRSGALDETDLATIAVAATAGPDVADVVVQPCGAIAGALPSLTVGAWQTSSRHMVVPLDADGAICLATTAPVEVAVDLIAFADEDDVHAFTNPVTVVDSTAGGVTADARLAGIGVRRPSSTLRVPLGDRFELTGVGALLVAVSMIDPIDAGTATVFAPESPSGAATIEYGAGVTERETVVVPLGASRELCLSTTGRTDVVVDLLASVPSSALEPVASQPGDGCPGQTIFPGHRVVALYGTQRSASLGVLGEQPPDEAAVRLAEVAEPWRAGDVPVWPAFELIATVATSTPEDRGVYNIRSSPEFVQEYLDVARRHGYYLILDIQPGRSDFLTEAKYYEEFLRQPDVGIALDPEWRTPRPHRPKGGFVGQVDAAEVNRVIDYVAQLVAEEDLPEKLFVVHQFQDRMVTNRDALVERPGVALTIHMDGFGDRANKLNTYDVVRAEPPIDMGLKLFYDEDIAIFDAAEVLGGVFDPVPVVITYQ